MQEEIKFVELLEMLKKRVSIIFSLALIGMIFASVITFFVVTPVYSSTTQLLVTKSTENTEGIQLSDINTNVQMINTYRDIIKGPVILEDVKKTLDLELNIEKLSEKITIVTQDNSQVFALTVEDPSPYQAADIANTTADIFKKKVGSIMKVDNVTVISEATPSISPVSPNNILNLSIGLFLGLMVGTGIAFLLEFMNQSVNDERFITENLEWSILGAVSEMSNEELKAKVKSPQQVSKPETRRTRARI